MAYAHCYWRKNRHKILIYHLREACPGTVWFSHDAAHIQSLNQSQTKLLIHQIIDDISQKVPMQIYMTVSSDPK